MIPTGVSTSVQIFSGDGKTQLATLSALATSGEASLTLANVTEGMPVYVRVGQLNPETGSGLRGVAAQWEYMIGTSKAVIPFEETIQGVVMNDRGNGTSITGGSVNQNARAIRKYGTVEGQQLPSASTTVSPQLYWIWGTDTSNQTITIFSSFMCRPIIAGMEL